MYHTLLIQLNLILNKCYKAMAVCHVIPWECAIFSAADHSPDSWLQAHTEIISISAIV